MTNGISLWFSFAFPWLQSDYADWLVNVQKAAPSGFLLWSTSSSTLIFHLSYLSFLLFHSPVSCCWFLYAYTLQIPFPDLGLAFFVLSLHPFFVNCIMEVSDIYQWRRVEWTKECSHTQFQPLWGSAFTVPKPIPDVILSVAVAVYVPKR